MPGKTSYVRMEASGRLPLYFKRNAVTFIIEWVLVKDVVPATYRDHHCRNWHLWCTLLISSSSHRFLVNTDFSFLYMWKVQRNIAWCQKLPLPPLPAHTRAQSGKQVLKKGCAVRPRAWVGATLATIDVPAAGEPALASGLWTCAPPHMMKRSGDCRRSLKSCHSHIVSHLLLICLLQDRLTISVRASSTGLYFSL